MLQTIEHRWQQVDGKSSGFDYLRIVLAVAILIFHSYLVAYGWNAAIEFWQRWPGLILQLMLPCFFALSGFLVAGSKLRSSLPVFLLLRIIRLFPALAVEVLLSALILGPILTTLPLAEYFSQRKFFTYFGNLIGWIHYVLPGVFLNNPFPVTVNSPLWTLPFELESYALLSIIVLLGAFERSWRILMLFVAFTCGIAAYNFSQGIDGAHAGSVDGRVLVLCFFSGMLLFIYRSSIPYNFTLFAVSLFVGIIALSNTYLVYVGPLAAAYITVYLGLRNPRRNFIISSGDYSYGTYIYAFPIQQTIAQALGQSNIWATNVLLALPITIIFALLSWHLVERPFQGLKKKLRRAKPTADEMLPTAVRGNA